MTLPLLPGSPAALDDAVRTLAARSAALDDAADRLAALRSPLGEARTAAAGSAVARVTEASVGARALALLLHAVTVLLSDLRERLAEAQERVRAASDAHAEALRRRARWQHEEESLERAAWQAEHARLLRAGGPTPTVPLVGDWHEADLQRRLLAARGERHRADEDARGAEAAYRRVVAEQEQQERCTATQLHALLDGRAVRAWALGTPSAGARHFLEVREAGVAAAGALARLAALPSGDGGAQARVDGDALTQVLRGAGSDPVFWEAFLSNVDPSVLYEAADRYVPTAMARGALGPVDPWPELMSVLAAGTAAWARVHTPAERQAFGRRAVAALDGAPDSAPEVLAAMLGAPPLGHQPVLGEPTSPPTTGVPGAAPSSRDRARSDIATGVLTGIDAGLHGTDGVDAYVAPTAAAALGMISRVPSAALAYLAPESPQLLDERAERWLGSSVSWPDAAAGVAAAFATASLVAAGSPSRSEQARGAQLVSRATTLLPGGLLDGSTVLSGAAERDVARAYHPHVGVVGDLAPRTELTGVINAAPADLSEDRTSWADPDGPPGERPGTRESVPLAQDLGAMPQPVQAELDLFRFREVVARTSATPEGGAAWLLDAADHQAAVLAYTFPADGSRPPASSGIDGPLEQALVVRDSLRDAGVIAGALQVRSIRLAEIEDAQRKMAVDLVADVVTAPIVMATGGAAGSATSGVANEALAAGVRKGVELATEKGVATFAEVLAGLVADQTWEATTRVAAAEDELRAPFMELAHGAAVAWSEAGGDSPEEAAAKWDSLEPDDVDLMEPFDRGYEKAADPDTGTDPEDGQRLDPEERP